MKHRAPPRVARLAGLAAMAGLALAPLVAPAEGFVRLEPARTGLTFTNRIPEARHLTNQLFLDGSGVAAGDVDGDGLPDLFLAGLDGNSGLWMNRGDWRFEPAAAGGAPDLAGIDATGCVLVDLSGDGAPELLVNTHGQGTRLFWNDGRGGFRPHPTPLNPGRGGHTLAVADVDGDGWPDVYVTNYRVKALMDMPNARATFRVSRGRTVVATIDGRPTTEPDLANRFVVTPEGGVMEVGEPDVLYRNAGGTNLVEVPWTDGAFLDAAGRPLKEPPYDWGLAAMFRDLDRDGRPELYVANDFVTPDRLWLNESRPGRIRFRLAPAGTQRHTPFFSMGVDFGDLDRDGLDDLLVLDMLSREHRFRMTQVEDTMAGRRDAEDPMACPQYGANALFIGRPGGGFAEVAHQAGLAAAEWAWAVAFVDVDLDGWEDVLVTNGQERAARDADVAADLRRLRATRRMSDAEIFAERRRFPRYASPNLAFRNRGDLTFEECGARWGFADAGVSHGIALADLDLDGDPDVVVNHLGTAAGLYQNNATAPRIAVRLDGTGANTAGVGARITVEGGPVRQSQEVIAGGRYLSGDAPERWFATGDARAVTVTVDWPSGRRSVVPDVSPGTRLTVPEPAGDSPTPRPNTAVPADPWFRQTAVTTAPAPEPGPPDEFGRQPLLPRRLSREGPPVAWWDVDGDGSDELVAGSGRGGVVTFHRVTPTAGLEPAGSLAVPRPVRAFAAVDGHLLAAFSNWDDAANGGPALAALKPGAPIREMATADSDALGAMAVADIDGDGGLEVFTGNRARVAEYPASGPSRIGRIRDGRFEPEPRFDTVLAGLIRVTGALWVDVDDDGDPDLIASTDWGPLRLLLNDGHGGLGEATDKWGLSADTGWWTGLAVGDFDGDGRADLVAGNRGLNGGWALHDPPIIGVHGTFGPADSTVLMMATRSGVADAKGLSALRPIHTLGTLGAALPALNGRFQRHADFARATVAELVGPDAGKVGLLEVRELRSCVYLNRGDHFEKRPLPAEAQWTPCQGIAVGDLDGDGHHDLFLAQNDFGDNFGWVRGDAGEGLVLRGNGDGTFEPLPSIRSGIREPGQQRGAAIADADGDGRLDLAVAMADGSVRVWHNGTARPGIRVRLRGPAGNPLAWGTRLRLVADSGPGPATFRTTGGGLGSLPGTVTVLSHPAGNARSVEVRWPDGTVRTAALPDGARSVEIDPSGTVREIRR